MSDIILFLFPVSSFTLWVGRLTNRSKAKLPQPKKKKAVRGK
jgi:hypothetical protein